MQTAQDIMTKDPITVTPETDVQEAATLMLEHRFNGLPVVDRAGGLVGIICQSDLITKQKKINVPSVFTLLDGFFPLSSTQDFEEELKKITAAKVRGLMTKDVAFVAPDTSLEDIASLMVEKNYHTLPVVDGNTLVGVVGKEDILRTLVSG